MDRSSNLIFVVGNSRSGTTVLGQILGKSHEIHTFGEMHFFEQKWSPEEGLEPLSEDDAYSLFESLYINEKHGYLSGIGIIGDDFEAEASVLWGSIKEKTDFTAPDIYANFLSGYAILQGKSLACEQTPRYLHLIETIRSLYPGCKFIVLVRDPRDVMLSQKSRWKRALLKGQNSNIRITMLSWVNYHPILTCLMWCSSARKAFDNFDSDDVLTVKFEDMIADGESVVKRISKFLGITYDGKLLNVGNISTSFEKTKSLGLDKSRINRWMQSGNESFEILITERLCKKYMEKFDYKPSQMEVGFGFYLKAIVSLFTLPIKILLAFAFNVKRSRSLLAFLTRRFSF